MSLRLASQSIKHFQVECVFYFSSSIFSLQSPLKTFFSKPTRILWFCIQVFLCAAGCLHLKRAAVLKNNPVFIFRCQIFTHSVYNPWDPDNCTSARELLCRSRLQRNRHEISTWSETSWCGLEGCIITSSSCLDPPLHLPHLKSRVHTTKAVDRVTLMHIDIMPHKNEERIYLFSITQIAVLSQ